MRSSAFWMLYSLLIMAALCVRVIGVHDAPAIVHNDEAAAAVYIAPPFLNDRPDSPFWGISSYGQHANFGAWLSAIAVRLAGESSLWAIRASSAVYGTISIALFALCVRISFGSRTALLFMLAALPFHFHVYFSRTGFHYIHAALAMAVVGFLLARFARSYSIASALVLGIGCGFGLMVYSASNVLLGALPLAFLAALLTPAFRLKYAGHWSRRAALLTGACAVGVLLAMGQHLLFLYKRGFQSRLSTQSIFNPDYLALWRGRLGSEITQLDLFWQTLLRTLKFFYLEDSAAQYGIAGPILEWVGAVFAVIGLAVMLYRVLQFDPVSVFTIAMGVGTVLGSAIMVEANFSPHLVAFTLIVPALCAVGLGAVLNLSRIASPVIVSLITLGLAFPWGYWNYRILSDLNTRRFNRDTWIYRLPIEATKVRSVVNVSHLNLDLGESFYKLLYPNSQRRQQLEGDALKEIDSLLTSDSCPCVLVFNATDLERVQQRLVGPELNARYFSMSKEPTLQAVYIDLSKSERLGG